jgi:hypothetical protein
MPEGINYGEMLTDNGTLLESTDNKLIMIKVPQFADKAASMFDINISKYRLAIDNIHKIMNDKKFVHNVGIVSEFIKLTGSNAVVQ